MPARSKAEARNSIPKREEEAGTNALIAVARSAADTPSFQLEAHQRAAPEAVPQPALRQSAVGLRQLARRHGAKLAAFSVIGAAVFALGLVLQVILVQKARIDPVAAYVAQTAICIQVAYLLNRYITWRDRDVRFWAACLRFNIQRMIVTAPSVFVYAALTRLGMGYLIASAITTAAFTLLNYAVGHVWSFAPDSSAAAAPDRHKVTKSLVSFGGIITVGALVIAEWAIIRWPASRWLVYGAWMIPLTELFLLIVGQVAFRFRFREAPPGTFRELIIQITTAGREHARVTEIIEQIHSYGLSMHYQIWVVTEPGYRDDYSFADRVLVVPERFAAKAEKKARALEYSRRVRQHLGLDRADVKIIFNDDDVTLTRGYIERAFNADYDICEGVVSPRTHYAASPFGHFLTSHADDIRTHACLVYCSVFQGIFHRPVHVHGEGLVVTGEAEAIVTWDWPVIASEDLVFGQRAASAGLRWGWFHEYAEITSPWSVGDFMIQRRRWLWGDIHAIGHRNVVPLRAALLIFGKYLVGVMGLLCSVAGLYLRLTGRIPADAGIFDYAKLSLLAWAGVFFTCGWIAAGSDHAIRRNDSRLLSGVLAVLMTPTSLLLTFAAIAVPLVQGNPRSFAVISKTRRAR